MCDGWLFPARDKTLDFKKQKQNTHFWFIVWLIISLLSLEEVESFCVAVCYERLMTGKIKIRESWQQFNTILALARMWTLLCR